MTWATAQSEEVFCDFIGLRLFGTAFLNAFAYLLTPGDTHKRSRDYPITSARVAHLLRAAAAYQIPVPSGYAAMFSDPAAPNLLTEERERLHLADDVTNEMVPKLIDHANQVVTESGVALGSEEGREKVLGAFRRSTPAEDVDCLADILCAAWDAQPAGCTDCDWRQTAVINELALKTIEIFEIQTTLREVNT
ncbi:MAG: hypothetical protein K8T90_04995 [Planctomycetes bacterium]|nr:hypothetical protein [Planctomycetota bacterium]